MNKMLREVELELTQVQLESTRDNSSPAPKNRGSLRVMNSSIAWSNGGLSKSGIFSKVGTHYREDAEGNLASSVRRYSPLTLPPLGHFRPQKGPTVALE